MPINHQEVQRALELLLVNKDERALNWAVNYARHALEMVKERNDYALHADLLYVVSNMTRWRGPEAKWVRAVLKQAIKDYN